MATNELLPFAVPAFVLVDRGSRDGCLHAEPVPLTQIDAGTLSTLCDRFRAGVFARAAQADPIYGTPAVPWTLTEAEAAAFWPERVKAGGSVKGGSDAE